MKEETHSHALNFALLLETACENFEILQALINGKIQIEPTNSRELSAIQKAMAKDFVANVIRAHRICRHGSRYLNVDKLERDRFLKSTPGVQDVRDVNEHGYDVVRNESKPSMHKHEVESVILDETSMIILGPEKILMGSVNLFDTYRATGRMRDLAGFKSLKEEA